MARGPVQPHHGVDVADSVDLEGKGVEGLKEVGASYGYPYMLKSKTEAYDGRGNFVVKSEACATYQGADGIERGSLHA